MRTSLLSAAFVLTAAMAPVPSGANLPYSPSAPRDRRETASGALDRADRRLEFLNRQTWIQEQNFGLNGRKNSTNDAARDAETPRAARSGFDPGWSPW